MTTLLWAAATAIAGLLVLRWGLHQLAKQRQWRIGPWSLLLPGWRKDACRRCATSFEYTKPHGLPVALGQGQVPGFVMALCETCNGELGTPAQRIGYYEELFREWAADPAVHRTRTDMYAIRAAVAAGL